MYKIVVVASDDAFGAAVDVDNGGNDIRMKAYHKVTVTVTDVDEDGSITLSNQQPQMGVKLTATLADQDSRSTAIRPIANETWKWDHVHGDERALESVISGAGAGDTDSTDADKASDDYTPVAGTRGQVPACDRHLHRRSMAMTSPPWRCRPTCGPGGAGRHERLPCVP